MNTLLFSGIAVLVALQIVSIACRLKKTRLEKEARCKFAHAPVPIDAQILSTEAGNKYTILLTRCINCGAHQVQGYPGSWTIADFIKTESSVNELERIAAK